VAVGYLLGAGQAATAPAQAGATTTRLDLARPEGRALVERVGALSGRLSQVEGEAAALARRLGLDDAGAAAEAGTAESTPAGGPLVPVAGLAALTAATDTGDDAGSGIAPLESRLSDLEAKLERLSTAATEHEIEQMAFPYRLPVDGRGVAVSSSFGVRHDPFTGRLARHTGLDIPAAYGTPILASGGGRVLSAGYKGAYGKAIVIDHGDGLKTLYGHASRLLVRAGDVVMPHQKIALVGSTGRSTGPHLHFEVIRNGARVEPSQYLAQVFGGEPGR
jgi:murein DD-endopeptidase MepM/ murein hydrolase activator NlpD